jgi:hypothetical protein
MRANDGGNEVASAAGTNLVFSGGTITQILASPVARFLLYNKRITDAESALSMQRRIIYSSECRR